MFKNRAASFRIVEPEPNGIVLEKINDDPRRIRRMGGD